MGGTYGAAPLACATANATLDVIQDEKLLQNSTDRGRQLVEVQQCTAAMNAITKMHASTGSCWYALHVQQTCVSPDPARQKFIYLTVDG